MSHRIYYTTVQKFWVVHDFFKFRYGGMVATTLIGKHGNIYMAILSLDTSDDFDSQCLMWLLSFFNTTFFRQTCFSVVFRNSSPLFFQLIPFLSRYALTVFALCLGSFSCWKMNLIQTLSRWHCMLDQNQTLLIWIHNSIHLLGSILGLYCLFVFFLILKDVTFRY